MYKVKFFPRISQYTAKEWEDVINKWLKENPDITIEHALQGELKSSVIIFYKDKSEEPDVHRE